VSGLGMKVLAFDEEGKPVYGKKGELVCAAAAPSMPIEFWNDPTAKSTGVPTLKYSQCLAPWRLYRNHRHWWHRYLWPFGRHLNPGGVRIGTAEIYRQVENIPEILDSLVVARIGTMMSG